MMLAVMARCSAQCRHVAQGIELLISRGNFVARAGDDAADAFGQLLNLRQVQIRAKTRNRLQLVERAARRAEAPARDHRHRQPTARQQRRENQRSLVSNAPRAVLINAQHRGSR